MGDSCAPFPTDRFGLLLWPGDRVMIRWGCGAADRIDETLRHQIDYCLAGTSPCMGGGVLLPARSWPLVTLRYFGINLWQVRGEGMGVPASSA